MIALGLVRVIERHSDELAAELITKLETSSRTADLSKVPVDELRRGIREILRRFGGWLLTKTSHDIEKHYFEIGERRASQGVSLSDLCWAIALTKGHLWEFVRRQGFHARPGRNLRRDGIVADAGPVPRSRFVLRNGGPREIHPFTEGS